MNVKWKSKSINGTVYLVTCSETAKKYVGITRRPLEERISSHAKSAERGAGGDDTIWAAIRKFGIQAFQFSVLQRASSLGELAEAEVRWIAELGTLRPQGFNQNRGGSVSPYPVTYEVEGEEYWGAAELADEYGIYVETVRKRLQAGWTPEQSVGLKAPPPIQRHGKAFEIGGKIYRSERELCRAFGVSNVQFRARLYQMGWTLEEALELEERANPNELSLRGMKFLGLTDAAKHFGLPLQRVRSRLRSGWTYEQAFELEPPPNAPHQRVRKSRAPSRTRDFFPATIGSHKFSTCREIAEHFGLSVATVSYRIRSGWRTEEVAGLQTRNAAGSSFKVGDVQFPSKTKAAQFYNVDLRTLESRLRYGWTPEQAVGIETRDLPGFKRYLIKHPDGRTTTCDNLSQFCRDHNLPNPSNLWNTAVSDKHHTYKGYSVIFVDDEVVG